jgi:hypothetical protein
LDLETAIRLLPWVVESWEEESVWGMKMRNVAFLLVLVVLVVGCEEKRIGVGYSTFGRLKNIFAGQEQFRTQCCVDDDVDGTGEYGLLSELSGARKYRGSRKSYKNCSWISEAYRPDAKGIASVGGYHFIIYLVGEKKSFHMVKDAVKENADKREEDYVVYAFPIISGKSLNRVFAMNSQGEIMYIQNKDHRWGGSNIPPPGLAYRDGKDPAVGSGEFVRAGDKGGADEPWKVVE